MRIRPIDAVIAAYLALQILWPLQGLWRSRFDTRGDFTWNMFSRRYWCQTAYAERLAAGGWGSLEKASFFNEPGRAAHVNHRDRLPHFHAWQCAERGAKIRASVRCSQDGGPWTELVSPETELCP